MKSAKGLPGHPYGGIICESTPEYLKNELFNENVAGNKYSFLQ